jgi:hypothetical protein
MRGGVRMWIFSKKAELNRIIKEQTKQIEQLKIENSSKSEEIDELNDEVADISRKNHEYESRYINTNMECEYCYTVLQKDFIYCPKCGKKIEKKEISRSDTSVKTSLFKTQNDKDGLLITQYNGFSNKKIIIPSAIGGKKIIGIWNGVFAKCTELEEVYFEEGCQYICNEVFRDCKNLRKVHLPKSLKEIGNWAFSGCKSLEEISLPPNVNVIGYRAFSYCISLKKILLPEKLQYISSGMLYNTAIAEINIPQSVRHIEQSAFESTNITEIELPYNLYSISSNAFNTTSLKEITVHSNVEIIEKDAFAKSKDLTIYCAAGSKAHLYAREYGLKCCEIAPQKPVKAEICSNCIYVEFRSDANLETLYLLAGVSKAATWSWEFDHRWFIRIQKTMSNDEASDLYIKLFCIVNNKTLGVLKNLKIGKYWGKSVV